MLLSTHTDFQTYLRTLSNTGKFSHDDRHPQAGDISGSNVVELSDTTNSTWAMAKGGGNIVTAPGHFNGNPAYRLECGADYYSANFNCSNCFSVSEGSFVMVLERSALATGSTMYLADDWQSYFYIRILLDGAAGSDSIRGFFNGSFKDIKIPAVGQPFILIARWKTGVGFSIETGEDAEWADFDADMDAGINARNFVITSDASAGDYVYHTAPFMMNRYLTDQEVYNLKVYSKSLGCKFTPELQAQKPTDTTSWWSYIEEWAGYICQPADSYLDDTLLYPATITQANPGLVTITGENFYEDQPIMFTTTGALPEPLQVDTTYYAVNASTNTCNVAATSGGAAIETTTAGSGTHSYRHLDWGLALGVYYDGENAMYKVGDKLTNPGLYNTYADVASLYYLQGYVIPGSGNVQGYRNFCEGLAERYIRRSDSLAQSAISDILANGSYVATGDVTDDLLNRECAYALEAHIQAERASITLTAGQITRRGVLLDAALGHIDQWLPVSYGGLGTAEYYRPFMGGLTARALISYFANVSEDSRIIPALKDLARYTWDSCWVPSAKAFNYTDRETGNEDPPDLQPSVDLSMLVLPLYTWLWKKTSVLAYHDKAKLIFEGCQFNYQGGEDVSGPYLGTQSKANPNGKIYNQQLFWGPEGLTWMDGEPD